MGSAALYFWLGPKTALLSDINDELVGTFVAIRRDAQAVSDRLEEFPVGKDAYYELRSADLAGMDSATRAARFIFLNRFCFNGLYRTNRSGQFNVPYGPTRVGSLPTREGLQQVASVLRRARIHAADFEQTLDETRRGDFVYIDPPYAVANRRVFRQYGPDSFGLSDIERLSTSLQRIHKRGVHFVISYAMCREAIAAFGRWNLSRAATARNISGFAKHRRKAIELIASNITI